MMEKKPRTRGLITAFMVIIGISGIGLFSWTLGQVFVRLISSTPLAESQEANQQNLHQILVLEEVSAWTCQVGLYQEKERAANAWRSYRGRGWKAEMIAENPYSIGIGFYQTKEEAQGLAEELRAQGIDHWIRPIFTPTHSYQANGKNRVELTVLLETSNELLRGGTLQQAKERLGEPGGPYLTGNYPEDFLPLQQNLAEIVQRNGSSDPAQIGQDLLELYSAYRLITTKYSHEETALLSSSSGN